MFVRMEHDGKGVINGPTALFAQSIKECLMQASIQKPEGNPKTGRATMKGPFMWCLLAFAAMSASCAEPGFVGIQAIGLTKWSNADIIWLAKQFQASSGRVELGCLPFTFTPNVNRAKNKMNTFVANVCTYRDPEHTKPAFTGTLRISVHLWFHRDEYYLKDGKAQNFKRSGEEVTDHRTFRWGVFSKLIERTGGRKLKAAPILSSREKQFLNEYQRRVTALRQWVDALPDLIDDGYLGKIRVDVCPYLEDEGLSDIETYNDLIFWLSESLKGAAIPVGFRRSHNPGASGDGSRPSLAETAIPMELHGTLQSGGLVYGDMGQPVQMIAGDIYSNDGCKIQADQQSLGVNWDDLAGACGNGSAAGMTLDGFLTQAKSGLLATSSSDGKSFLMWRFAYNVRQFGLQSKNGYYLERGGTLQRKNSEDRTHCECGDEDFSNSDPNKLCHRMRSSPRGREGLRPFSDSKTLSGICGAPTGEPGFNLAYKLGDLEKLIVSKVLAQAVAQP